MLYNLALDRILEITPAPDEDYQENTYFDPTTFLDDMIGVTKGINEFPQEVRFRVNKENTSYVLTKPFHKSQYLVEKEEDGSMVFQIKVVINQELHREILGFGDGIRVLSPPLLVRFIKGKLPAAAKLYEEERKREIEQKEVSI